MLYVKDPDVVLAIRFIRENAARPIRVDDVIDQVPMSRRSIERRFRTALGRSISDEIRRAHVERAKQLLLETDLQMPELARAAGFGTATRLGIVFRQAVGMTPTEFRARARRGGGTTRKP